MTKSDYGTVGIIAAMQIEIDGIYAALENPVSVSVSGIDYVRGTYCGKRVVAAKCGIGKVFAALCAQTMILEFNPDCIVNTGVAGGLAPGLEIFDIVVADDVVQHDMDTSAIGDPVGLISGINIISIPADRHIADALCESVGVTGARCVRGTVASGDKFISTDEDKKRISEIFGAAACEMEGAAVGQVCYVNKVPFGVLRAISDGGDEAAATDYPVFAAKAAENSVAAAKRFIEIV